MLALEVKRSPIRQPRAALAAARAVRQALVDETLTFPKPGLVSHIDSGSHIDMNAGMLLASAAALEPFFAKLYEAGARGSTMAELRTIGRAAESAMMRETGGVNTHRGAIFALGLLCAASGLASSGASGSLGSIVLERWSQDIGSASPDGRSHGAAAHRLFGAGGARAEAAGGFPTLYTTGRPALRHGRIVAPGDEEAARAQCCFALIAVVEDTNLLHRGGREGLGFARAAARTFLERGGIAAPDWRAAARAIHEAFVEQRLSPGGSADLLAATLLVDKLEAS